MCHKGYRLTPGSGFAGSGPPRFPLEFKQLLLSKCMDWIDNDMGLYTYVQDLWAEKFYEIMGA